MIAIDFSIQNVGRKSKFYSFGSLCGGTGTGKEE
jgi:hypothetical protein